MQYFCSVYIEEKPSTRHKNLRSCLFNTHCNQPASNSNALEPANEPLNSSICNILQIQQLKR